MSKNRFLALLRGVNVGGKAKLNMAELRSAMIQAGFSDVVSYINSGNIIFSSAVNDTLELSENIKEVLLSKFGIDIDVVVLSKDEWKSVVNDAPPRWGNDISQKHNLIIMLRPYNMREVMNAIGELKPEIESAELGNGVVYQSLSLEDFGKTTSGKLTTNPIYKRMTIRNYNTTIKLLALLD